MVDGPQGDVRHRRPRSRGERAAAAGTRTAFLTVLALATVAMVWQLLATRWCRCARDGRRARRAPDAPRTRPGRAPDAPRTRSAASLAAGTLGAMAPVRTVAVHGGADVIGPDTVWRAWNVDPLVLLPLFLALRLYRRGVRDLWTRAGRGRGVTRARAVAFAAGMAALVVALVSPLDPRARRC